MFTEPRAKAEVLNSQFSGAFNNEKIEDIPDPGENPIPTIGNYLSQPLESKSNLVGWRQTKRMAQMESPLVFKEECPGNVYQDCINTGTVPSQWKYTNVYDIHKKGKKSDPSN